MSVTEMVSLRPITKYTTHIPNFKQKYQRSIFLSENHHLSDEISPNSPNY
jgi:hypothetical protein